MSRCSMRKGVSLLRFKKDENEKDDVGIERLSLSQTRMPAIQGYYAEEGVETLTLFWKEVGEQVLRKLLDYGMKRRDGAHVREHL